MEAIRTDEEKKLEVQIKARFRQAMVENAVAFSSLTSSQNNSTSGAIVNLDDEDGRFSAKDERQHFFVRTARFRKLKPSRFSILKSSKVSILSALRPSDLLDSPILQPARDQAEPSPTTGSSPLVPIVEVNVSSVSDSIDKSPLPDGGQIVVYKPMLSFRRNELSSLLMDESTMEASKALVPTSSPDLAPQIQALSENAHQISDDVEQEQVVMQPCKPLNLEISLDDVCSWRKYGQKVVKNSKFPRNYFRCAHPNCPVKKIVEESQVLIRGEHNHPPKAQVVRKLPTGAVQTMAHKNGKEGSIGLPSRTNGPNDHSTDASSKTDSRQELPKGPTHTSEPSVASSIDDERVSTEWSKVDERESVTKNKIRNDKDDTKSRKKLKVGETTSKLSLRTFHEPRHVERIKCYSDVVDDGYRWCKYGQKSIKGNPHPRSYYKCHSPGCPVRKHVERSATDETTVISTYEGEHNHDAPASRSSMNTVAGSFITAINLPPISGSPNAITKSQQHRPGGKLLENDNNAMIAGSSMSVTPVFPVTDPAITNVQPLSMCLASSGGNEVVTKTTTLQLLTPGSDRRPAFQKSDSSLSRQNQAFMVKSEPSGEEL